MTLQAFIDDSRDDPSGTYVLAGYIASVEKWAAFSEDWEKLLPLATKNKNGVHRFKMAEMNGRGRMNHVPTFHRTILKHVDMAVACIIDKKLLRAVVDRLVATANYPGWGELELAIEPLKVKWRDPFFCAFRALMDGFHQRMHEGSEFIPFKGPVDFVFDREQANEKYIRSIWQEYIDRRPDEYRDLYGRTPQFEDEEKSIPLQAADFRAWWIRKWAVELGAENAMKGDYPYEIERVPLPGLLFTMTEEQMAKSVGEAIGTALEEGYGRGLQVPVKPSPSARFWPRDPL